MMFKDGGGALWDNTLWDNNFYSTIKSSLVAQKSGVPFSRMLFRFLMNPGWYEGYSAFSWDMDGEETFREDFGYSLA